MKNVLLMLPSAFTRPGQWGLASLLVQKICVSTFTVTVAGSNCTPPPPVFLLMLICTCSGIRDFLLAINFNRQRRSSARVVRCSYFPCSPKPGDRYRVDKIARKFLAQTRACGPKKQKLMRRTSTDRGGCKGFEQPNPIWFRGQSLNG